MNLIQSGVPARYMALLFDHLERSGTSCGGLLDAAQQRNLNEPQARLAPTQLDALLRALANHTGRGDLAFELGRQIKLNSHDVLGYAMLSSQSTDHALRLVSRYFKLMTPTFTMQYQRCAGHAETRYLPVSAMSEASRWFQLEVLAVSYVVQVAALTQGRLGQCEIHLPMPEPAHAQRYRELGQVQVQFGTPSELGLRIVTDAQQFDRPLPMSDPRTQQQAEASCKVLLQEMQASNSWSDWVAMMLREAEDHQPTLEQLARIRNISARTLDRHLSREAVSFRDLAAAVRNTRALQMLDDGVASISQVAYRLGYTDQANFSRWFKRSNGISPSSYLGQRHKHPSFTP